MKLTTTERIEQIQKSLAKWEVIDLNAFRDNELFPYLKEECSGGNFGMHCKILLDETGLHIVGSFTQGTGLISEYNGETDTIATFNDGYELETFIDKNNVVEILETADKKEALRGYLIEELEDELTDDEMENLPVEMLVDKADYYFDYETFVKDNYEDVYNEQFEACFDYDMRIKSEGIIEDMLHGVEDLRRALELLTSLE